MDGLVRVLLVDDHPVARLGLQAVLAEHPDLTLCEALPDEAAAIRYLAEIEAGIEPGVEGVEGVEGGPESPEAPRSPAAGPGVKPQSPRAEPQSPKAGQQTAEPASTREPAAGSGGRVRTTAATVAVLDLYLAADTPCLSLVEKVGARMPVLVVSASARPADVLGALAAGARGYLIKSAEPALLASSIRAVAHGGFAMSAELADILQSVAAAPATAAGRIGGGPGGAPGSAAAVAYVPLSAREEQALDLIARGFTHAQTASRMGVSVSTVDTYIDRIRGKLGVGNKAELTTAALTRAAARSATR